ncbi:hypothetical protein Tco_1350389, partial [Tanacetum coccineum]
MRKAIMKGIKEVDELEQRIKNVEEFFFKLRDIKLKQKDSSEDLINFPSCRDPQWQFPKQTQEEEPKPLDVPMQTEEEELMPIDVPRQTEEEDLMPLDIVYPHPEIASSSRVIMEYLVKISKKARILELKCDNR